MALDIVGLLECCFGTFALTQLPLPKHNLQNFRKKSGGLYPGFALFRMRSGDGGNENARLLNGESLRYFKRERREYEVVFSSAKELRGV